MKRYRLHRPTLLFLLAMACGSLWAQAPSGYYDNAAGKTGTELRQALHDIIDNHTTISYGNIWNAFWATDNKGNGVVWDMYSDVPGGTPPYTYMMGENQCGNQGGEGVCYNREHSWPKSWFSGGEDGVPGRDLHHIFPTDGYVNAQRSNYPYGEVQNATWTSLNGSKLGNCKSSLGYSGTVFEPIDEYKGDFARAYFYMSTRYYGEDSDWNSSGMTNKAEILPWAMTMLLRWSDNDPVSQKEIDRNNAIYNDYQHNRNPFIDHPEFAHLIWDDEYQGGVAYHITCETNLQNGSISAPSSAVEGFTVNLYAYPSAGYMVDTWYVWKTGDQFTTIPVTNNSFVMPAYDVTVSATFVQNTTPYAITCLTGLSHGSITVSVNSAMSGTNVELSNTPETGYSLYSYYVYKTGDINTIVYAGKGDSFVMPAFDVTVSASFAQGTGGNGNYVKVTSAPASWSGEYLIVYETGSKAFNGALTNLDDTPNTISVAISNNTIEANASTNAAKFTIATMSGGYSIKAESGKYIGITSNSNGLTSSDSPLSNTISYNNGDVDIVSSGGAYLRYNAASNQQKFRYFKSSTYTGQKAIQLYKKTDGSLTIPTHKVHFYGNGGTGTMSDQTVDEFVPTPLNDNAFTREGYAFVSWNTAPNGSGVTYSDGASVTLLQDLMLYAQWDLTYDITCLPVEHGTISTSVTEASEGTVVTLIATPNSGYEVDYWEVTDANNELVEVTNNQFVMPGSNVNVSAGFVYVGTAYQQKYYLVTSTDQLVEGRTYLIVNTAAGKAMGAQSGNNRDAEAVDINNNSITSIGSAVCELTLG
ncbi:MAG: endonuclease, partial [Muribaculaceae bacterium]|nr:endonuclease [Muribaculaceae bacterium]